MLKICEIFEWINDRKITLFISQLPYLILCIAMVKMSHKNLRIIAFLKIKWSTSFFCGLSKKSSKFYFWKLINFIVWKQLDTMAINLRLSAFSIHLQITSVIIISRRPSRQKWVTWNFSKSQTSTKMPGSNQSKKFWQTIT